MKPRYSLGKGNAPRHVVDIQQRGRHATIDVLDEHGSLARVECGTRDDFQLYVEGLIAERVPFSVGGMCPGASEALNQWFLDRGVAPQYLEISWRGPNDWIVREIVEGATEWQEVSSAALLENDSPKPGRS